MPATVDGIGADRRHALVEQVPVELFVRVNPLEARQRGNREQLRRCRGAAIYANKQLDWYLLHESVPAIRADAVHVAGITGKGIGVAILDSGIDGLLQS